MNQTNETRKVRVQRLIAKLKGIEIEGSIPVDWWLTRPAEVARRLGFTKGAKRFPDQTELDKT